MLGPADEQELLMAYIRKGEMQVICVLFSDFVAWGAFLVDDPETFAEDGHVLGGFFADSWEGAGEVVPVLASPIFVGEITLTLIVGKLGVDLIESPPGDLCGFEDAAGIIEAIDDDGEGADGEW